MSKGRLAVAIAVALASCTTPEPKREFSAVTADGGTVRATFQYRVAGCTDSVRTVPCYYYAVTFRPRAPFDPSLVPPDRGPGTAERDVKAARIVADIDTARRRAAAKQVTLTQYDVDDYSRVESGGRYKTECELRVGAGEPQAYAHVKLRLYDRDGFSLYRDVGSGSNDNYLAPGWNDNPDEASHRAGEWRWQGRFPASSLPLEQFRRAAVLKAELAPGCPA